jgi:hypothetical protein
VEAELERGKVNAGWLCSMCEIGEHCKGGSRQVCLCPCGDEDG